jgi:Mg2+-importing ATPase
MDILCTDKTGTLTEATIKMVRTIDGHGVESERAYTYTYVNSQSESGMKCRLISSDDVSRCWWSTTANVV